MVRLLLMVTVLRLPRFAGETPLQSLVIQESEKRLASNVDKVMI